ncbi:MAG: hypothetical protein AAGC60_09980 [Acidobacteriota bacterium]
MSLHPDPAELHPSRAGQPPSRERFRQPWFAYVHRLATPAKWLAALLVAALLLGWVIGLALPATIDFVDVEHPLEATPAEIFPLLDSRAGQQRLWTRAWERSGGQSVPPMKLADLGGPRAGIGTRIGYYPDGDRLGSFAGLLSTLARGEGVITESIANERVEYRIDFGFVIAHRAVSLHALDARYTKARWVEQLHFPNPLARWLQLAIGESANENFRILLISAEDVAAESRTPG